MLKRKSQPAFLAILMAMATLSACQKSCPFIQPPYLINTEFSTRIEILEGETLLLEADNIDGHLVRWQLPTGEVKEGNPLLMGSMEEEWAGDWVLALKDGDCVVKTDIFVEYTDLSPEDGLKPNAFRLNQTTAHIYTHWIVYIKSKTCVWPFIIRPFLVITK